jgi:hypothetical protein
VGFVIADCRFPIASITSGQLTIGNWQSALARPTRYRVVVLTSSARLMSHLPGWNRRQWQMKNGKWKMVNFSFFNNSREH